MEPVPNSYVNIVGFQPTALAALAAAIAGGITNVGKTPLQQQTTLTPGNDTIVVTANGGILPSGDASVLLFWTNGLVSQDDYTRDRVSEPNELVLDSPVDETTTFTLLIFV